MKHSCPNSDNFSELAESFWEEHDKKSPDKLFHYCSVHSALNISTSKKMWASAFECMNDEQEFRFGLDLVQEDILKFISSLPISTADVSTEKWENFLKNERENPTLRPYILSFSENDDNDYLWKNYADNYKGILIGFKNQNNIHKRKIINGCFLKVSYNACNGKLLFRSYLEKLREKINACNICIELELLNLYTSILQTACLISILQKREEWHKENEWRMVFFACPQKKPNSRNGDIKFRLRADRLIDYLDIDLCTAGLVIESLAMGKNSDCSKTTLELFKKKLNEGVLK